jgi:Asp-tRNA(Asn)/Glu-tRNA(Gln) amidotransferase A subunit family amidase
MASDCVSGALRVHNLSQLLETKQISPVELVDETLQAIEQTGASVNAFITVAAEQVLDAARRC